MVAEIEANLQAIKGLKGVVAADSQICDVDGDKGILIYRGYYIDDLAQHASFEETIYLLFHGELPNHQQLQDFNQQLISARPIPQKLVDFIKSLPHDVNPMAALRTAMSYLAILDPDAEKDSVADIQRTSFRLISQIATITAAIRRVREGLPVIDPRQDLSHAGNFLYMLNGKVPSADETESMDMILVLHAEHGLNASTFAARVIAATLSDIYSSVTGAIGGLKGSLHGGANTEVLETLMKIGSIANVDRFVEDTRAQKGKFMGFGHAVYKVEDPRAKRLKELSHRLSQTPPNDPLWYDMSIALEKKVFATINRHCNVDFYSASLQHYMGIPGDMFTCIFAVSRIVGWCAHIIEQISDNKIIRPQSHYVGPALREYIPIDMRK
jgi:citrate synthase